MGLGVFNALGIRLLVLLVTLPGCVPGLFLRWFLVVLWVVSRFFCVVAGLLRGGVVAAFCRYFSL